MRNAVCSLVLIRVPGLDLRKEIMDMDGPSIEDGSASGEPTTRSTQTCCAIAPTRSCRGEPLN